VIPYTYLIPDPTTMSSNPTTFMECEDGHRCQNGSVCTENPYDEGSFYCDCDEAIFAKAVAGLYCEHEATTYCTFKQEVSRTSFCTNGGECKVLVSAEAAHLGCDCPAAYEGSHCQFVAGTKPDGWPFDGSDAPSSTQYGYPSGYQAGGKSGLSGGVKAITILIVLGVVGSMAFFVYKKRTAQAVPLSSKDIAMGSELALEPDGSGLQDSVAGGASVIGPHSTSEFSGEVETLDDGSPGEII
jgi:hypothetical protein